MIDYLFFSMDTLGRSIGFMLVSIIFCTLLLNLTADKGKRNTGAGIGMGILFGFFMITMFLLMGGVRDEDRLNFCNKYQSLNSENIEEFTESCIFYSVSKYRISLNKDIEIAEEGYLKLSGYEDVHKEIIEKSYNKVVDEVIFGDNEKLINKAFELFDSYNYPLHSKSKIKSTDLGYLKRSLEIEEYIKESDKILSLKKVGEKINIAELEAAAKLVENLKELEITTIKADRVLDKYCKDSSEDECVFAKIKAIQAKEFLRKVDYRTLETLILYEKEKLKNIKV